MRFPKSQLVSVLSYLVGMLSLGIPWQGLCGKESKLDYNRDVRPILSDRCYRCHGPDADNQDSEFRLDSFKSATADLGGYAGIVPGDAEASELHFRIWEDVVLEERMPPPDSKLSLTDEEKRILDRWIEEGAEYDQHWSFKPIGHPDLPELSKQEQAWAANGIDHFVAARLRGEGLAPTEQASRETLIRRVSLDLTGLPPTPEEVDTFVNDQRPGAWERVVDRLLASPHYGERMALVWLDAARYADSGGYQFDMKRTQWPWRDWVIEAYNQNMPFDEFTIEQLAGDLLPHPSRNQLLATAFNRNHRINNEGGIVPEEYLAEYVADRVETTSTVWLGLTMTCARCHDHKYDPITQKDYYQLFAYFNNLEEYGQGVTSAPVPNMAVYTDGTEEWHQWLKNEVQALENEIRSLPVERQSDFEAWLGRKQEERAALLKTLKDIPAASLHLTLDSEKDRMTPDARDASRQGILMGRRPDECLLVEKATYGKGFKLGRTGYIKVNTPFSEGFDSRDPRSWIVQFEAPKVFAGSEGPILAMTEIGSLRGYRIMIEDTGPKQYYRISFQLMENSPERIGIEVVSGRVIQPGGTARIGVTWDGSNKAEGVRLYVNGKPVETTVALDNLPGPVYTEMPLLVGARAEKDAREHLRDATLNIGTLDDVQIYDSVLSADQMAVLSTSEPENVLLAHLCKPARSALGNNWVREDEEGRRLIEKLKQKQKDLAEFEEAALTKVSIMKDTPGLRKSYVLKRGAYDQPDLSHELAPDTPEVLPTLNASLPHNRLGLAKWIVDPGNPLTARVAVNRYWQMYFGIGLVKTPEDFGLQGESPSHPELLDWLASEFIRSGWDIKAMQKRIVMSATYRQASRVSPELLEKDPENRLLARGPRFRLSGQALRDQALAVAGLLVPEVGGPPVMPYQPEGLWDELNAKGYKYIVGKGADLYRRSLYTFWRRTVPPPSMINFDNASREACTVRSTRTNTPLQALNLMNDVQFVEAARALAERMLREGGESPSEQIAYGHRLVLSCNPDKEVLAILLKGYEDYVSNFKNHPDQSQQLVAVGASEPDANLDPSSLAAMTVVSNTLLNLDETLTKE
ncbi:MAG: DUF1553 domain-containing protein [Verrucomicrobiae bacterium]|nr:DUF1553 domain-containing protein [Verrucomicrobiae bacterium]